METLEGTGEASRITADLGPAQGVNQNEVRDNSLAEWERDFQVNECSEGEMAGDEWWDLESAYPSLEGGGAGAPQPELPQHLPSGVTRPPRPAGTGQRKLKKRPRAAADQHWEEARQSAWLRQMLSDATSDEDEDEERYGRFAESGRWMSELYGFPQHLTTTSGGECSA